MNNVESLLPPNATAAERALEAAVARAFELPVGLRDLWNPATCPPHLLAWLAWSLSVDEWAPEWDDFTQRAVIAESLTIHLQKGTVQSVKRILELVGFPAAALTEWWQVADAALVGIHSGEPHTFSIGFDPQCNPAPFDPALYTRLRRLLAHTAPVRSHICLYLDIRTEIPMGVTPVSAPLQQVRQVHCLARGVVSKRAMGVTSVASAVEVVCVTAEL